MSCGLGSNSRSKFSSLLVSIAFKTGKDLICGDSKPILLLLLNIEYSTFSKLFVGKITLPFEFLKTLSILNRHNYKKIKIGI
jgi:hypothetical protein